MLQAHTTAVTAKSVEMRRRLGEWKAGEEGRSWVEARSALPAAGIREGLLAALRDGDIAVVGGETGCGKTTQVPTVVQLWISQT